MSKILIDTNIYTEILNNNKTIIHHLQTADEIGLSVISIGELMFGFRNGKKFLENKSIFDRYCSKPRVYVHDIDHETIDYYSEIKYQLKIDGKPIPSNNIWIAATAMQHGLRVLSFDKHFQYIKGVLLVNA